jgi:dolichol kinase
MSESLKNELYRKAIHATMLWVPISYLYISKELLLCILVPLVVLVLAVEQYREKFPKLNALYMKIFAASLRPFERERKRKMTGATPMMISFVLTVVLFPKFIAIAAMAVLVLADSAASLIGKRFGRHKLLQKSVEGTCAFFLTAVVVSTYVWATAGAGVSYLHGLLIASAVATVAELLSYHEKLDDNFTVPLCYGAAAYGFFFI